VTTDLLTDELVATLLLEKVAGDVKDRSFHTLYTTTCFGFLDRYVALALDDYASPESRMTSWAPKRQGERMQLAAMVYVRKLARDTTGAHDPAHKARMRLPHSGAPSTWHLKILAEAAQTWAAACGVSVDQPLPRSELFALQTRTGAGELLRLAATHSNRTTTVCELAVEVARSLFTPARNQQISRIPVAPRKARLYVRKKLREAIAAGAPKVSLATSALTTTGNLQVEAACNLGLLLWHSYETPYDVELKESELVSRLWEVTELRTEPARVAFAAELQRRQNRRSRLSPLAIAA
jgi:hypothetical protein